MELKGMRSEASTWRETLAGQLVQILTRLEMFKLHDESIEKLEMEVNKLRPVVHDTRSVVDGLEMLLGDPKPPTRKRRGGG